jgi:hypothetical protein
MKKNICLIVRQPESITISLVSDKTHDTAVFAAEPIDNEDDPNLLVERGNFPLNRKNLPIVSSQRRKLRKIFKGLSRPKRNALEIRFDGHKNESSHAINNLITFEEKTQQATRETKKEFSGKTRYRN